MQAEKNYKLTRLKFKPLFNANLILTYITRRQDSKNMIPMSANSIVSQPVNLFSCARVCMYTFITIGTKAHSEGDIQIDSQLYFSSVPRNRSSRHLPPAKPPSAPFVTEQQNERGSNR